MVKQIIEAGRWVKSAGLSWANSGNISAVQDGAMLITASGTRLDCLTEHDIVPCAGAYDKKPSKEYPMHAAVYAVRPDVKAVLHASPYYTIGMAFFGITPTRWRGNLQKGATTRNV